MQADVGHGITTMFFVAPGYASLMGAGMSPRQNAALHANLALFASQALYV